MRKPIQISTAILEGDGNWSPNAIPVVTALCEDGSIWIFHNSIWERLPEIPNDCVMGK